MPVRSVKSSERCRRHCCGKSRSPPDGDVIGLRRERAALGGSRHRASHDYTISSRITGDAAAQNHGASGRKGRSRRFRKMWREPGLLVFDEGRRGRGGPAGSLKRPFPRMRKGRSNGPQRLGRVRSCREQTEIRGRRVLARASLTARGRQGSDRSARVYQAQALVSEAGKASANPTHLCALLTRPFMPEGFGRTWRVCVSNRVRCRPSGFERPEARRAAASPRRNRLQARPGRLSH